MQTTKYRRRQILLSLNMLSLAIGLAPAMVADEPQEGTSVPSAVPAPVARWTFDEPVPGTWQGKPRLAITDLRGPEYPRLRKDNQAAFFPGKGVMLRVREQDVKGNLRFAQGDAITLEAWVNPVAIGDKAYAYIVGKGRTDNPGFAPENQNYALRLTGAKGEARLSFLFRSQKGVDHDEAFHRWTAASGFPVGSGWHHVAVTYTFGKPVSLRGYVDGTPVTGTWDMGGATTHPPVVDGDDLLIGAAKKGAAGNAFHGWLDEIAIYRAIVPATLLARNAAHVPAAPITQRDLPADKVVVEICEQGVPVDNLWPAATLTASETYTADAFAFFRLPYRYVETGIRGDRAIPLLMRASAYVELPAGTHRLVLRGRGAARLFIDGKAILKTPFPPPRTDGHNQIPTDYLDLGPDFRFAPPGNRETCAPFTSTGKKHLVVLETIVGGRRNKQVFRPEMGETVVAMSPQGTTSFHLLGPRTKIAYTDAGWKEFADKEELRLLTMEAERRAQALRQFSATREQQRELARQWLASTPEPVVPPLPAGYPGFNAIDHFLAERIARVRQETQESAGKVDFHKEIKPILESRCFACHQGKKVKGGLRLDTLKGMLEGGDSELPALVRGDPKKSTLLERAVTENPQQRMPPDGERLTAQEVKVMRQWIQDGAPWPLVPPGKIHVTDLTDDLAFLRRLSLDTVGVVPTLAEVRDFLADTRQDKRARRIDRYLADSRWADHWVGYWQDVLAENPNILNPTLNNTGPYRWWIYESFLDNKPMDLFAAELVRMGGSHYQGGPAGFAMASENDVPMAEKGVIIASAFLGVQMKCARCHDAPAHQSTQKELFQLASLLAAGPLTVPKTSSVPQDKLHGLGRKPLISVTLQPGTKVEPAWPFTTFVPESTTADTKTGPRERAAVLLTSPANERFAQVLANRLWRRIFGRGLVEPVDDWEKGEPSHPELLRYLGRELVRCGYDYKQLARLICNSHAYQRAVDPALAEPGPYFAAPARRRLGAEQIVDSLFLAAGKSMDTEEVCLDIDGSREMKNSITLGKPRRAWQFASTSNERDRPSLALPRVQAVVDVLEAFGWRPTRQDPRSTRDISPNVLQPAILANGTMSIWLTRLSDDHGVTRLALEKQKLNSLVEQLFLQVLTRKPRPQELASVMAYLSDGYDQRIVSNAALNRSTARLPPRYVSWSNHLTPEANEIKIQLEAAARRGDPPTPRLAGVWRERLEDVLWALLNDPEFVFSP